MACTCCMPCDGVHNIIQLEVKASRNGKGAFTRSPIAKGNTVWLWYGTKVYRKFEVPFPYGKDEYLQIGPDQYIGPDGLSDAGDFVNHSCNPNCAVEVIHADKFASVKLVALRDIGDGEEITYDYAATMSDDPWTMKCNCGEPTCRGEVKALR